VTPTAIDSHAHVFVRGLPLDAGRRHEPDHDATLADYLALLDAHGISHGVLVQPSFLGTDNRFLRAALRARADRLRGVAVVDASIDDAALRGLDDDGVRGIRLNLIGRPAPDLEGADWRRLFARVRALDWHVEVHAESQRLGAIAAPVLAAGCALVVDHFGRPSVVPPSQDPGFAWLLGAATHDRVWVKLSAAYRNAAPTQADAVAVDAAQALCAAFGAERLVWGSDWPHTQHRDVADFASAHAALVAWVPDADARRRILVDTPARLFKFQRGDSHAE
jgi:predicted TIM-barrel fold metal-dependent hydrolase